MISPEDYKTFIDRTEANEALTVDETKALLESIRELDAQAVIFQNAVILCSENTQIIIEALAEGVLQRCGRTDKKIKRAVAKMAANALSRFEVSLQLYLTGAFAEAGQLLNPNTSGEDLMVEPDGTPIIENDTATSSEEEQ